MKLEGFRRKKKQLEGYFLKAAWSNRSFLQPVVDLNHSVNKGFLGVFYVLGTEPNMRLLKGYRVLLFWKGKTWYLDNKILFPQRLMGFSETAKVLKTENVFIAC